MPIGAFGIKKDYEYNESLIGKNVISLKNLYIYSRYDTYDGIKYYYAMENDNMRDSYGTRHDSERVIEVGTIFKVVDDTYKMYNSKSSRTIVLDNDKITFAMKSSNIDKYFSVVEVNYGRTLLFLLLFILIIVAFYINYSL